MSPVAAREQFNRVVGRADRWAGVAGPTSIVILVLVILHDVAFGGMVSDANVDLLYFWMPDGCFLGEELRAGRIPHWNPYAFGGTPFASDPQSGWLFAPLMMFGLLPCTVAMRALILVLPLLAGLGSYAFLRAEKASRVGATVAGLTVAGLIAGSALAATVTFAGFMAWAPWMLAAASKAFSARSWAGRLVWSALAGLAWGQVAGAHISNGLVMASALIAMFALYKGFSGWRSGRLSAVNAAGIVAVLALFLVLANLAYLLPRFFLLERSSIGLGYEELRQLTARLKGWEPGAAPEITRMTEPGWMLRLAASPGAHVAAGALALSFAGLFGRRHRGTSLTLLAFGSVFYLLGLRSVVEALEPLLGDTFVGEFYIHAPSRFIFAEMLALGLLTGFGADAWREQPSRWKQALMVVPGIALWWIGPYLAGAVPARMVLLVLGAAVALLIFAAAWFRPALIAILPLVVAVELVANGLIGQRGSRRVDSGLPHPGIVATSALPEPDVDPARFVRPSRSVRTAGPPIEERWLSVKGRGFMQYMFYDVEHVQGYNPVQLNRYWRYWRSLPVQTGFSPRATIVNETPPASTLDLFQIGWVETPPGTDPPLADQETVHTNRNRWLFPIEAPSKATVFSDWERVGSAEDARQAVVAARFDPSKTLILEDDPGIAPTDGLAPRVVSFTWVDPSTATIDVDLAHAGVMLVRVPYDSMWRATIEGETIETRPADYVMQAIPVPEGRHTIELAYRDYWVTRGLWGWLGFLAILGAIVAVLHRGRRPEITRPENTGTPEGVDADP